MEASVVLRAPAKLNLTLEVLARRDDGFHNLRSVMVPVDLYDHIALASAGEFTFACNAPDLAADNLVLRALDAVCAKRPDLRMHLHKSIPAGSGMGGGSSDAAAILHAAMTGALGPVMRSDYVQIARNLGSDVPFFLAETAALVEGTGERVTPLGALPAWHATILRPPIEVSTAAAFGMLAATQRPARPRNTSPTLQAAEALQRHDFAATVALLGNDFEAVVAAKYPAVASALSALRQWNGVASLTGSGSCVYTLWNEAPPQRELQLPPGCERFDVQFVSSDAWRATA
ncbi:MAG: 4-(cytidine 5'-diphospho)-2-C-methyl-D-erythritol kinase [Vulcanimicrobiaceae bacterium]